MYLLNDPNRRYFINEYGLKAQIASLEDGGFCLTRYSYPDKVMHNQIVEQHITHTFEEAVGILDRLYGSESVYGKDNDGFHMFEVGEDAFVAMFDEVDEVYNLNRDTISLGNCRDGYTNGVRVKVGHKELLLDIYKQRTRARVSVYGYKDGGHHAILLKPNAIITRDLIEDSADISYAQKMLGKYGNVLA